MIRRVTVCLRCDAVLTRDERETYGRECHVCVTREYELVRLVGDDRDHPDRAWLDAHPVDISPAARRPAIDRAA